MTPAEHDDEEFVREVDKQADRRRRGRGQNVWRGLAQVGTIGWMVSLPAVGAAFLGRWLDVHYRTGVFWTLSLVTVGLALGCAAAWRTMMRELHE